MNLRRPTAAVQLLLAAVLLVPAFQTGAAGQNAAQLGEQALDLAYNLDHDQAVALLRRAVALAPDDPAPHRALASVLWLNMLYRRGAVTVDHYLGAFTRASVDVPRPPPDVEAEFKTHVQRAVALAERRVRANRRDTQARYDLGAALGLEASYVATVEGRMLAGFRAARRSFDEHEEVLALDSSRLDGGLIVGTYRYLVSTLSLPMRAMAYVAGFGGDRGRGIQLIEGAARESRTRTGPRNDARTEAMFALILVYNRERRYDDALRVIEDLRRLYPRNRLLVLEAGATALRAGRGERADELLTEGLSMLLKETRTRIPGEEALWRYKRGAARASIGRANASEDLRRAVAPDAQAWVSGRARVELGRLDLARNEREAAAANARAAEALCRRGDDPVCVEDARAVLRRSSGR